MLREPRPLTILLLACALFLRVVVPAGWMPAVNGGALGIELCAAAGPAPMVHADHGSAKHHQGSQKSAHPGDCSFAPLHAGVTAVAGAPAVLPPMAAVAALPRLALAAFFATGPPALPPPATGPPAIA